MKITKQHLDDITRCYCASSMKVDDELVLLLASEDPKSRCICYSGKDFEKKELVWDDAGGCMSIIPFATRKNQFLAVQEFYLKVTPSLSKIVWGTYDNGWIIKDVISLPYLHRFDIYHIDGVDYFIGATIARQKEHKEDWSYPGQIYVGVIPSDPSEGFELREIVDGCFRNHGYCRGNNNGAICGYFGSDQGILRVTPPLNGNDWHVEKIMEGTISEMAFCDIDGDGQLEMMTIEPFHGNSIKIYKLKDGKYECDFVYPTEIDFAHSLVGTTLAGKPCFVAGIRRVDAELVIVTFEDGNYQLNIVEKGVGPANLAVVHTDEEDLIIAANHTKNEAAVYHVRKD